MVEHQVARPSSPLDPSSVRALRADVGAVDCRHWLPVFHEGVREILRLVRERRRQILLFEIPPALSIQLALLGVAVSENKALITPEGLDVTYGHCPSCGGMLRLGAEGSYVCAHCRKHLTLADGSILAL